MSSSSGTVLDLARATRKVTTSGRACAPGLLRTPLERSKDQSVSANVRARAWESIWAKARMNKSAIKTATATVAENRADA